MLQFNTVLQASLGDWPREIRLQLEEEHAFNRAKIASIYLPVPPPSGIVHESTKGNDESEFSGDKVYCLIIYY